MLRSTAALHLSLINSKIKYKRILAIMIFQGLFMQHSESCAKLFPCDGELFSNANADRWVRVTEEIRGKTFRAKTSDIRLRIEPLGRYIFSRSHRVDRPWVCIRCSNGRSLNPASKTYITISYRYRLHAVLWLCPQSCQPGNLLSL